MAAPPAAYALGLLDREEPEGRVIRRGPEPIAFRQIIFRRAERCRKLGVVVVEQRADLGHS
jgi:hypothetical protein